MKVLCSDHRAEGEPVAGLVSVITPTFNRRELLRIAGESVLAQTYRPIEWVVVDDGSTDGTANAVEEIRQRVEAADAFRIAYVQQENRGAPAARNAGLRICRGEYVQYLDSDDTIDCEKIALQVEALNQQPEWGMVYGASFDMENGARCEPKGWTAPEDFLYKAIRSWTIPTNNPLIRMSACHSIGLWDEHMRCFEDATYFGKFFSLGCPYGYVPEAKSLIRGHHVSCGIQNNRVSFRGESSRYADNAEAQAKHLAAMYEAIGACATLSSRYRRAFSQEAFRILRMLYRAGRYCQEKHLVQMHGATSSGCFRSHIEMWSLQACCFVCGKKRGAAVHENVHNWLWKVCVGKRFKVV